MALTGTYERNLDEKRRLALPKRFRQLMSLERASKVFLTPGTNESLQLHSPESLQSIATQLQRASTGSEPVQLFARLFYAQTENCELDAQGRICIPSRLAEWAKLRKEVVLLGVGTHIEVWNAGRWNEFFESRQAQFDSIVYQAFDSRVEAKNAAVAEAHRVVDERAVRPR